MPDVEGPSNSCRCRYVAAAAVVSLLVLTAACGTRSTSELAGGDERAAWGAIGPSGLDDSPDGLQPADPAASAMDPGPQVMSEITLPGGGVPTVPQPSVPAPSVFVTPSATVPGSPRTTAPSAPPTTSPPPPANGGRAVERLGDDGLRTTASQALGLVRYDWQRRLPGWQVRFLPGRSGYRGLTYPDDRVIEVFVRGNDTPAELSHVIAHELGHAADVTYLNDRERDAWRSARGIGAATPWFPGVSGATDFSSGAGDFAESFAAVHTGVGWFSELGPPPDPSQAALLVSLT